MREYSELEEVIQAILDSIDRNSNMWTRKNPQSYHSAITLITLDLRRDRADILSYLSEMKNSLADIRPDVVKCWDCSKNGKLTPIYSLLVQIKLFGGDAQIVAMSGKRLSLTALKVTVVQSALKGKSVDAI